MLELTIVFIPYVFTFLVIYGALSDLSTFRIPNWVSYGLVLLFALHVLSAWAESSVPPDTLLNIVLALLVVFVAVVFWKLGFIGGGDVKFLTAISLWMGSSLVLPFFLLLSMFAILFAATLVLLVKWEPFIAGAYSPAFLRRLLTKITERRLPYGFPIGLAALSLIPRIFSS